MYFLLNELFIIQIFLFITLFFFLNVINVTMLWYLAGIYLIMLGFFLLINDADILTGFLWVIDLGVGLVFFIFILHFTTFLHQKSFIEISSRFYFFLFFFIFFILAFYWIFSNPSSVHFNNFLQMNWFFFISWYNYYTFFNNYNITDLSLLREIYYYNNSFEFFLVNFFIMYGLFSSIILSFLIKRIFSFLNASQLINLNLNNVLSTSFFIRNQNFIRQQNTTTGTRAWIKKKKISKKNDF